MSCRSNLLTSEASLLLLCILWTFSQWNSRLSAGEYSGCDTCVLCCLTPRHVKKNRPHQHSPSWDKLIATSPTLRSSNYLYFFGGRIARCPLMIAWLVPWVNRAEAVFPSCLPIRTPPPNNNVIAAGHWLSLSKTQEYPWISCCQ